MMPATGETATSSPRRRLLPPQWPLLPAVVFLVLIFLMPVALLLRLAFLGQAGDFSMEHVARIFQSGLYLNILSNTFRLAIYTSIFCLVFGYPLAYMLATVGSRTRNALLIWVLVPLWTSFLVRALAWIVILGRRGVIADALERVGLGGLDIPLLYNFTGMMIGTVHALLPIAVLTMLAVMQNIDGNLSRAAATLGARGAHAFWRIYFPLSFPGVAAAGLLTFVTALGFFIAPQLLGSPEEVMIAQAIIRQLEEAFNWGFSGALSLLLIAVTLIVFFIFDRTLGMSILSGEGGSASARKGGPIARFSTAAGRRVIAAVSWGCAYAGELFDRLNPVPLRNRKRRRPLLILFGVAVVVFLAAPAFFLIPISFSQNRFLAWPPTGFTLDWYEVVVTSPLWQQATWRSIYIGLATAVVTMAIGVPAAFVLARQQVFGKTAIMAVILLPMVLPQIIVAVSLFYLYAQIGLIGSDIGLVLGHTIFALPYVLITTMAVLRGYDRRLDQAAAVLGANAYQGFMRITLPLILPGLITAFLFAFIKSFDELTVALFIADGAKTTLPRQLWTEALYKIDPSLAAVSTLMILIVGLSILIGQILGHAARLR